MVGCLAWGQRRTSQLPLEGGGDAAHCGAGNRWLNCRPAVSLNIDQLSTATLRDAAVRRPSGEHLHFDGAHAKLTRRPDRWQQSAPRTCTAGGHHIRNLREDRTDELGSDDELAERVGK
jgi:hypothetical protein